MNEQNLVTILESLAKAIRALESEILVKDYHIASLEAEIKVLKSKIKGE